MFFGLVTFTLDLLTPNKRVSIARRILEHFYVKFDDPSCIGF